MDWNLLGNCVLGFAVATYGTLVGTGGGFLLVPLFLLLLHVPHETAVGTSLAIVTVNALSGAVGYMRQGKVDYRAGVIFGLATVPGAVAGSFLTGMLSGPVFQNIFGGFLLAISAYLFFRKKRLDSPEREPYSLPQGVGISLAVGIVSSWLGIGGGILHVPAMTEILKFPVHVAVATSQFILFWTALVGVVAHGLAGRIDWPLAVSTGIGAVLGAQLGVKIAPRLKGNALLRYLSVALVIVGLKLLSS